MHSFRHFAAGWFFATVCSATHGAATLPQVFSDHMVLQADRPLPVWGNADPGEAITVRFAGQDASTRADSSGRWRVVLKPLAANNRPQQLEVIASNRLVLSDVLVGEVWICAGQSNMEWQLRQSANAQQALETAEQPTIRLLNLPGAARGGAGSYTAEHLARLTTTDFCRGSWARCAPETARPFSAVGFFFGSKLHDELDRPIGLISPAIGGTPAEAWVRRQALAEDEALAQLVQGNWLENPNLDRWCQGRAKSNLQRALESGDPIPGDDLGPNHSFKVGFMWDAGIAPLIPFAIRGVIWYQGESNAESPRRARQHRLIFPRLVKDWRAQWGQGDFPIYYVQLPALGRPNWPVFREGQRRFLDELAGLGMAITMDVGHPTNVHPTQKRPVGERLARLALAQTYGRDLIPTGPLLVDWQTDGKQAVVHFNHVGEGLATRDARPPVGFETAGSDGVFAPAQVEITGNGVRLAATNGQPIEYVRYGWAPFPDPPLNLINSDGLPASPFTTEDLK